MKFFNEIKEDTKEIIYRVLSGLLSSFLFTSILPIFMFILYMKEKSFFSYDFFIAGLFGLNIFFIFSVVLIMTFSFFITSGLFLLTNLIIKKFEAKTIESSDYIFTIIFILINILLVYISLGHFAEVEDEQGAAYFKYLAIVSVPISIHFAIVIFAKAKISIISLIVSFSIIISIFMNESAKTSHIIAFGLQTFNSGNKKVEVKNFNNENIITGTMLLLSPNNIFIHTSEDNQTSMIIINRDNIIIDIKN